MGMFEQELTPVTPAVYGTEGSISKALFFAWMAPSGA